LPVPDVLGRVGIDQVMSKKGLALPPIHEKVLDQEARSDHPNAIVKPTSRNELAHSGVDDWEPSASLGPSREIVCIIDPIDPIKLFAQRTLVHPRFDVHSVGVPVSPCELSHKTRSARGALSDGCDDCPRRNRAEF
jgi:hypothetical protein